MGYIKKISDLNFSCQNKLSTGVVLSLPSHIWIPICQQTASVIGIPSVIVCAQHLVYFNFPWNDKTTMQCSGVASDFDKLGDTPVETIWGFCRLRATMPCASHKLRSSTTGSVKTTHQRRATHTPADSQHVEMTSQWPYTELTQGHHVTVQEQWHDTLQGQSLESCMTESSAPDKWPSHLNLLRVYWNVSCSPPTCSLHWTSSMAP